MNKKNKKGSDKIISIYWFVILGIIAGGVVAMVHVFYSSPYDVREVEANVLAMKVANCIEQGGKMDKRLDGLGELRPEFKDNFMNNCKLNFDVKNEFDLVQYYVLIDFYRFSNLEDSYFQISSGNQNWVADCEIEEKNKKLVRCSNKEFFTQDESGKIYLVKILSIVRNTEKNVA